jgi:hypothetical protein
VIRVSLAEEPASFDKAVRTPGLRAIAEMVGERPARNAGKRYTKSLIAEKTFRPTSSHPIGQRRSTT